MTATIELEYQGPPALVGALAQMLADEGLRVTYTPPVEEPGLGGVLQEVVVGVVVTTTSAALQVGVTAAIERFRARFPEARVEGKHER